MKDFNLASSKMISQLLFGGTIKVKKQIPVLNDLGVHEQYKTGLKRGEYKYKNQEVEEEYKGFKLKPHKDWISEAGNISTGDTVLKTIAKRPDTIPGQICQLMLEHREISKQINTYYEGFKKLLYEDSCIRGQLSHCGYDTDGETRGGTGTGRLSSTKPNLQNIPRGANSNVKQHFTSRYNQQGCIVECDAKQLEVVVFGFLTQDVQLIKDLCNGVDIHKTMASIIYQIPIEDVTKDQRQYIKGVVFAIIYGAGAARISKDTGTEKEFAQRVIDNFFQRYPMARDWQNRIIKQVNSSKVLIDEYTKKGLQKHEGRLINVSGRKLVFKTNDSPQFLIDKGELTGFNPPDIKDYPVQSLATADIIPVFVGMVWRKLINYRENVLLINTIHDSIVFDCKKAFVGDLVGILNDVCNKVPERLNKLFNINFNVPFAIEIKIGDNWKEMKEDVL